MNSEKWKNAPIKMVIKKVVEATGDEGLLVDAEIKRLNHELAAKEAAVTVLMGEAQEQAEQNQVLRQELAGTRRQLAEAGK